MSELSIGLMASIALGICVIDSFFWMWGGREGKWKRRFLGAGVQTIGINTISLVLGTWVWQFSLSIFPEILSRTMGSHSSGKNLWKDR